MDSDAQLMPSLFIAHGTPMLGLAEDEDGDAHFDALRRFAPALGRPKAIVVVSSNSLSEGETVEVTANLRNSVVHDFQGFPPALYQLDYPAPGQPDLAARITGMLGEAGFTAILDSQTRLGYGAFMPLKMLFPDASIPVVQVSMPESARDGERARTLLKIGRALAPLRREGILLVGTGGVVYNSEKVVWHGKRSEGEKWARDFEAWVLGRLMEKDVEALVRFQEEGPEAGLAQPKVEHLLPLFFTIGAALEGDQAFPIHKGIEYGSVSTLSFALAPDSGRKLH